VRSSTDPVMTPTSSVQIPPGAATALVRALLVLWNHEVARRPTILHESHAPVTSPSIPRSTHTRIWLVMRAVRARRT
jgi:hypothetical protein